MTLYNIEASIPPLANNLLGRIKPRNHFVNECYVNAGQAKNTYCEAQGKGRAKGQPRKVTYRSFIDCRL